MARETPMLVRIQEEAMAMQLHLANAQREWSLADEYRKNVEYMLAQWKDCDDSPKRVRAMREARSLVEHSSSAA